jgi:hypothetical protein
MGQTYMQQRITVRVRDWDLGLILKIKSNMIGDEIPFLPWFSTTHDKNPKTKSVLHELELKNL